MTDQIGMSKVNMFVIVIACGEDVLIAKGWMGRELGEGGGSDSILYGPLTSQSLCYVISESI